MKPKIVLVLGMHRSGTSALAGVLNHLGAEMPGELMPAAADNNRKGFFESRLLYRFHEDVLREAGSSWDDCLDIPDAYWTSPAFAARREELAEILRRDYATRPLTAVKDPRMCRLLPLWRDAARAPGLEALAVLPLRHPLEVAASLERRNEFGPAKSLLVWLRHVLSAERGSRDMPRVFTTFDGLLSDWSETVDRVSEALGVSFAHKEESVAKAVTEFLEDELRHNVAFEDLGQREDILPEIRDTWAALNQLVARSDDPATLTKLDEVGQRFGEASRVFAGYVAWTQRKLVDIQDPGHLLQEARRREHDLARAQERIEELEQARRERDALRSELDALQRSTIWRWTSPLRRFVDWSRGQGRAVRARA